jgi:hypothetical protein
LAIAIYPLGLAGDLRVISDTDSDTTIENNVNDGPATIYGISIDNNANAAVEYSKFYNAVSAVVGTTAPDMILMSNASSRHMWVFTNGLSFSTGLSFATVTAGGTAGVTSPTSDIRVDITVG